MQLPAASSPSPDAILEWLHKEMGYQRYSSPLPSPETLQKICRGNMIPIWEFLLRRVKSEKMVDSVRRNILVHGTTSISTVGEGKSNTVVVGKAGGRRGKMGGSDTIPVTKAGASSTSVESNRERALREREVAEKEVERLRHVVQRRRKELRAQMVEVSREEADRKRIVDERAASRHKQVMLEAYDLQCEEATRIFSEYQKRIQQLVDQAKDAQKIRDEISVDDIDDQRVASDEDALTSNKSTEELLLMETPREKNIRKACESLATLMINKIRLTFPSYEGGGVHVSRQSDAAKLGVDVTGEVPDDIRLVASSELKCPIQLLRAVSYYTSRMKTIIAKETDKIDVRADAERLRYKYENNRVLDASDASSLLQYQEYGNGTTDMYLLSKAMPSQIVERQKAHVQQFIAIEDALNKAAEAKGLIEKLIKRLHGADNGFALPSSNTTGVLQNVGSLRHLELDVWSKEREAAGLGASLNTLTSEVQRLKKLCTEWKEAEDSLRKKWKKIEEFEARRSELEVIYNALVLANKKAASFWDQQPSASRKHASITILPTCLAVVDKSTSAKDLIQKESYAFSGCPDNALYMLPSTPQALLESMASTGSSGAEAYDVAEKTAAILTARAGARDPSAIPSICRVSAALRYCSGPEGSDAGLASVLESLEFCLKLRGSEASVLEDLADAINQVHVRQYVADNGRTLLNHALRALQDYERTARSCLTLAADQDKLVMEKWVPELRRAVLNAQNCLEDCKRVRGLVDDWWEQPAATVVDWVTVDGKHVGAWLNHVKQLQTIFYDQDLR